MGVRCPGRVFLFGMLASACGAPAAPEMASQPSIADTASPTPAVLTPAVLTPPALKPLEDDGVVRDTPDPTAPSEPVFDAESSLALPRATGAGDWVAGDYPPALREQTYLEIRGVAGQQDLVRQYKVHVPPSYDPERPTPLVFCFHGLSQNAVMFCVDGAGMVERADQFGYLLVMPTGFENSWNAGTCCGSASTAQLDDVALVRAILEQVGTHLNVDLDRVYATGFSNGGYMSFRLACEAADLFSAIAPGSGAVGINEIGGGTNPESDFVQCVPGRGISVLAFHGSEDTWVSHDLHEPSLAQLAAFNACSPATAPAAAPPSAGDTTCTSYTGCANGTEVTGCSVAAGGHVWFGSSSCGTGAGELGCLFVGNNSASLAESDAAWSFFERVGAARIVR